MLRRRGATSGNAVEVCIDGDAHFERLWAEIDAARRQVWVESYLLEDDRVGRRTLDALLAALKRGCDVILLIDAFGSSALPNATLRPLVDAGGRLCVFNPPRWWSFFTFSLLQRNHRKVTVIDGRVAFVGGMNISEDYAGARHGRGTFRDCHLRIEGPAAQALARSIARVLSDADRSFDPRPIPVESTGAAVAASASEADAPGASDHPERLERESSHALVQVLESSGRTGRREIQREMRVAFNAAHRTLDITTPYFVPPRALYRVLKKAAARGVAVRLVTAGRSDAPMVTLAARHIYDGLLRSGVRIFEVHDVVLHAKTAVVDGVYAMIGSFNLDRWSDKRNLEIKVGVVDAKTIAALSEQFESLVGRASEVTLDTQAGRPWHARALQWLAYQGMRI